MRTASRLMNAASADRRTLQRIACHDGGLLVVSDRVALITGVTGQDGAYLAEFLLNPPLDEAMSFNLNPSFLDRHLDNRLRQLHPRIRHNIVASLRRRCFRCSPT
jgi:hypothetical protein